MAQIEYVDRYTGLENVPSPLTCCHGQCEALGVVPVTADCDDPRLALLWAEAEAKEHADDGWHFVTCPDCGGTGRGTLATTVRFLPGYLVRKARFLPFALHPDRRAPHMTWPEHIRLVLSITLKA